MHPITGKIEKMEQESAAHLPAALAGKFQTDFFSHPWSPPSLLLLVTVSLSWQPLPRAPHSCGELRDQEACLQQALFSCIHKYASDLPVCQEQVMSALHLCFCTWTLYFPK